MIINKVKDLYLREGLSAREIGERLGMTTWQVIRFMKKHDLVRRTPADTQRIQFDRKPLSYNKKQTMSSRERALFYAGLLLYWGEGVKSGDHVVDFTNSNDRMILIFLTMLRRIYRVKEEKLRVLLYCYANQDTQLLLGYWSRLLNIRRAQFIKPYIRKDFDVRKIHKMPYGLVHIRYNDKRLFMHIQKDIDIISSRLLRS